MKFLPPRTVITESEEETRCLGALLSNHISGGITILLSGDLGSGKTTLVRGFCENLGFRKVRSPSFTLVNHYMAGGRRIVHSDLYRLEANLTWRKTTPAILYFSLNGQKRPPFFPKGLYGE